MGEVVVARGDVWWLETVEQKGRPVLVITRDEAIPTLQRVMVAPITSTLRNAPSQLRLGTDVGLPHESVANFDDLAAVPKSLLVRRLGALGPRIHELCAALQVMAGC